VIGQRFGRLTVVRDAGRSSDGHVVWECVCDCGGTTTTNSNSLRRSVKGTRSCGCLRTDAARARRRVWNAGRTYQIPAADGGERVYRDRWSWQKAVLRARGNRCERCGWDEASCDAHHIVERSAGGLNTVSNSRVLCPNCHRIEHQRRRACAT